MIIEVRRIIAIGLGATGQPFTVVSDPLLVRWQAEGAPSCGATWQDEEVGLPPISERCWECEEVIPPGEEHTVGGHCYHPACCPGCAVFNALTEPAPNCAECGQLIDGLAHPDGTGNYYCDKCCPICDKIDDSRWCICPDQYGDGPCPVCGREMCPF